MGATYSAERTRGASPTTGRSHNEDGLDIVNGVRDASRLNGTRSNGHKLSHDSVLDPSPAHDHGSRDGEHSRNRCSTTERKL